MPRRPRQPALADTAPAAGGVATLDRALSILGAFQAERPVCTLAQLAAHTQVSKSTLLRMLASLVHARVLRREPSGAWALGAEVARLAAVHTASFALGDVVLPELHTLSAHTGESVAFHVRQGTQRLVLYRVDSPHLLRDHVRAGDLLPLDKGAGGRVLMAFGGAAGHLYERIRADGHVVVSGDRVPGLVGISAPVWQADGRLAGALTLTAPEARIEPRFVEAVRAGAARLSAQLGGTAGPGPSAGGVASEPAAAPLPTAAAR